MGRILMISSPVTSGVSDDRTIALAKAVVELGHTVEIQSRGSKSCLLPWVRERELSANLRAVLPPSLHRGFKNPLVRAVDVIASRFLETRGYDAVISSAHGGIEMPRRRNVRYLYDFTGLPSSDAYSEGFVERHVRTADVVVAGTPELVQIVGVRYGRRAELVPDATDPSDWLESAKELTAFALY